jgi:hypothetical protein
MLSMGSFVFESYVLFKGFFTIISEFGALGLFEGLKN